MCSGPVRFLALGAVRLWGCGTGGEKDTTDTPAVVRPDALVGTWTRPISGADGTEGIRLDVDGVLGLVNMHTLHGVHWDAEGDLLILATNTGRYPEPTADTLRVAQVTKDTLTLEGTSGFQGVYMRDDAASGRLNGIVVHEEGTVLPPNAAVQVTLSDAGGEGVPAAWIAGATIPASGRQFPVPWSLTFAAGDIHSQARYVVRAVITVDGRLRFTTTETIAVDPLHPPAEIVIPLTRANSDN